jgi:5-aminolevulinate synthase
MRRNNAPGFMPVTPSETYIVAVMVGDLDKRKKVSDLLLAEHGIFVQPIKHPTVPRGIGGRRITPTAYHDDSLIDALARALLDVWGRLGFPLRHHALAEECFGKFA